MDSDKKAQTGNEPIPIDKSSPLPGGSMDNFDPDLNSLSVNVPDSKTTNDDVSDGSEETEETATADSESARTEKDEAELEQELITKMSAPPKLPLVKPTNPGIICWNPKEDSLEQRDPVTGAIKFLKNTSSLCEFGHPWLPHWVIDEGRKSNWPPREFVPPVGTDGQPITGPLLDEAMDEYNKMVSAMAEQAIDWPRIKHVTRVDRQWPFQAFAHINDLDRSLTGLANQMVNQAASYRGINQQSNQVELEERSIKKTKDFMAEVGKMGDSISQEFGNVADGFTGLANSLDTARNVSKNIDSSSSDKREMQQMQMDLQTRCKDLKTRLMELKSQIADYGVFASKHIKDIKTENAYEPLAAPVEMVSVHRSVNQCATQMEKDIESDAAKDKSGIFKRWYRPSRLHQFLETNIQISNQFIKESEAIARIDKLKPIARIDQPVPRPSQIEPPEEPASNIGIYDHESASDADDDNLDFYSAPERKIGRQSLMAPGGKQKKEVEQPQPKSPEKFDFYTI